MLHKFVVHGQDASGDQINVFGFVLLYLKHGWLSCGRTPCMCSQTVLPVLSLASGRFTQYVQAFELLDLTSCVHFRHLI